jgi:hypothetical protein
MADTVETAGEHMDEESPDELISRERHELVALGSVDPIVFPLESHPLLIACDQSPVGDGDPMRVARQIAQHLLGTAEWALAVDHPFAVVQWRQECGKGFPIGQRCMIAEELQLSGSVSGDKLLQKQSAEQLRQHLDRE